MGADVCRYGGRGGCGGRRGIGMSRSLRTGMRCLEGIVRLRSTKTGRVTGATRVDMSGK